MSVRLTILILTISLSANNVYSQIAGEQAFDFLNIPSSARITGLGGANASSYGLDLNQSFNNPASINDSLAGFFSANYLNYFADANLSSFVYAHQFEKYGMFNIGLQHMSLGNFQGYDASGNATNTFSSGSTSIMLGHSRMINNFSLGVNMKIAISSIAGYRASALLFDLGGMFVHPNKDLSIGLVLKSMGFVTNEFTDTSNSSLPFDVQLGATFKPEHMPFRFSVTALNFADLNNAYHDPNDGLNTDELGTIDEVLTHVVVGTELLISKNVNVRAGYNHKVRNELRLQDIAGGAGFSFGFMLKIKSFEFAYGHGGYHVAGGTNNFTVTTNVGGLMKKN